jgi:hypothetical protein
MAWESSTDIFGRLDWINKKTKNLLGRVYALEHASSPITTTTTTLAPEPTYKVYTALLYQEGVNPPTTIVLENTLGVDIVWTRLGIGLYQATYDPSGVGDCGTNTEKVFLMVGRQTPDAAPFNGNVSMAGYYGCVVSINTVNDDAPIPASTDGVLMQTPVEIRVYN